MIKKYFQVVSEIAKVETMESGLKLTVYTNEVAPEEETMLFGLRKKQGWFLFAESQFKAKDIENLPEVSMEEGEKTPSQRMRAVLFRIWEQSGGTKREDKKTFEQFYREQMERLTDKLKEKLT